MTKTVAASNAPAEWKAAANYVCDGTDDHIEIQSALSSNEAVILSPGLFNIRANLTAGTGNITGQGMDQTHLSFRNNAKFLFNNNAVQTIDGFSFDGSNFSTDGTRWMGLFFIRGSNKTVQNVSGTADNGIQAVFYCLSDPSIGNPIQNITFKNCHVADANTYAFVHSQWYYQTHPFTPVNDSSTHKNIRYENCTALRCGSSTGFNPWVTGFDFAEMNHIDGLVVKNCRAEQIWESGFHFEFGPQKRNCLIEDCISKNNGQKPYKTTGFSNGYTYPSHGTDYFGDGFVCVSYNEWGEVRFRRCLAEGNSWYGFHGNKGVVFEDCTETKTGVTLLRDGTTRTLSGSLKDLYKPAGYRMYPSRGGSIQYTGQIYDCLSIEANGYGVEIDSADRIYVDGLTIVDPVGNFGRGCSFGVHGEQFTNVTINNLKLYSNLDTPIQCRNNVTAIYDGGYIVTTDPGPVYFTGGSTSGCQFKNFIIYSDATLQGETGVTRDGSFVISALVVSGMTKQAFANAPPKPGVTPPVEDPTLTGKQVGSTIVLEWEV